jgi:uncharacterized protein
MKHLIRFREDIAEILDAPEIQKMKDHIQHGKVSVFSHSVAVADYSCRLAKKMRMNVDFRSLARGALLHDFFLYDWHDDWDKFHGFRHPQIALENADNKFELNKKERNIIRKHMWPMTFTNFPTCKEAWLVCIVDKYCSLLETFKIFRYNFDKEPSL